MYSLLGQMFMYTSLAVGPPSVLLNTDTTKPAATDTVVATARLPRFVAWTFSLLQYGHFTDIILK